MPLKKIEKDNLVYTSFDELKTLTCREVIDKKMTDFVLDERTKAIDRRCFKRQNINSIAIPKNLAMILDFAFFEANIVELLVPENVYLRYSVFEYSIINNIFLNTNEVPKNAFANATIKNIKLKNTKKLASHSFRSAEITKITLPDTLEIIDEKAFERVTFKDETLTLPSSLKEIKSDAFAGTNLKRIVLPKNLEYLSSSFINSKNTVIVCDEETVERFPFLKAMKTEIISIDYFLKQHMSFKEINKAYKKLQER